MKLEILIYSMLGETGGGQDEMRILMWHVDY